jgi:hypothetical protein
MSKAARIVFSDGAQIAVFLRFVAPSASELGRPNDGGRENQPCGKSHLNEECIARAGARVAEQAVRALRGWSPIQSDSTRGFESIPIDSAPLSHAEFRASLQVISFKSGIVLG